MNIDEFFKKNFPGKDYLFTGSGRAALQAVIEDFNLKHSKMILPSFICTDIFLPLIKQNDICPILVDCPRESFNLTLGEIKKAYYSTKKVKSVLIVHTFGEFNKDTLKIKEFCEKKGLILIEDCAHIFNLKINGKQVGSIGDASIFSFSKVIELSLGGAYIKNRGRIKIKPLPYTPSILDIYRKLAGYSLGRFIIQIIKVVAPNKKLGINPKNIRIVSAPDLLSKYSLKKNEIDKEKRKEKYDFFLDHLKDIKGVSVLKQDLNNNYFHSLPILVNNRDIIFRLLNKNKINCKKFWTETLGKKYKINTPNADYFSDRIINLLINERLNKEKIYLTRKILLKFSSF